MDVARHMVGTGQGRLVNLNSVNATLTIPTLASCITGEIVVVDGGRMTLDYTVEP